MLPAIDAILAIFSRRRREVDMLDKIIDNLHQSDDELERRLRSLRTQVDVYERTTKPEGSSDA